MPGVLRPAASGGFSTVSCMTEKKHTESDSTISDYASASTDAKSHPKGQAPTGNQQGKYVPQPGTEHISI